MDRLAVGIVMTLLAAVPADWNGGRPLPIGAVRLGSPRSRMPDGIRRLQFAANGRHLIVATGQYLGWVDPLTGRITHRHSYPPGRAAAGRLLADGSLLLLARTTDDSEHYSVVTFDPVSGKVVRTVKLTADTEDDTAFSPDGRRLTIRKSRTVTTYDAGTGGVLWHHTFPQGTVSNPAFVRDGARLAVILEDNVVIFDAKTGDKLQTLTSSDEKDRFFTTIVDDGRRRVAVRASDGQVRVWDSDGRLVRTLKNADILLGLTDSAVLTLTANRQMVITAVGTGDVVRRFDVPADSESDCALSSDGKLLAVSVDDAVLVYDTSTGRMLPTSADPPGLPNQLRFHGEDLVGRFSDWGGWLRWTPAEADRPATRLRPEVVAGLRPIGLLAGEQKAVYQSEDELVVRLLGTGSTLVKMSCTGAAAATPDGSAVVFGTEHGLTVLDGRRLLASKIAHGRATDAAVGKSAALSADGRWAAVDEPTTDGETVGRLVQLYDLTARRSGPLLRIAGDVKSLVFADTGHVLAIELTRRTPNDHNQDWVQLVEPASGRTLLQLTAADDPLSPRPLALSADGRQLARVGGSPRTVQVWEVASGQVRRHVWTNGDVKALAFHPTGRRLAVAETGAPIFLYDLFQPPEPPFDTPEAATQAWNGWGELPAEKAYRVARRFAADPARTVQLFTRHLVPVPKPSEADLLRTVDQLGAPSFAVRQQATRKLQEIGELAGPALRTALARTESTEVRERIEGLLGRDTVPTPRNLRVTRAVEVLEGLGTPEAVALLRRLAGGADGARLTREATAALARLKP